MKYEGLDEVDARILELLVQNGRMSYADLGRILHFTRASVRERIQNLVRSGVIEGFTAVINPRAVGRSVLAFFEIDVEPSHLLAAANLLARDDNVLSVHQMTGPSTLHVHASLKDNAHLRGFLEQAVYSLKGVTMVKTYLLLNSFKSKFGGLRIN